MSGYFETLNISNQDQLLVTLSDYLHSDKCDHSTVIHLYGAGANGKSCFIQALTAAYPDRLIRLPIDPLIHGYPHPSYAIDPSQTVVVFSETDGNGLTCDEILAMIFEEAKKIDRENSNRTGIEKVHRCFIYVSNQQSIDTKSHDKIVRCYFPNRFSSGNKFVINDKIVDEIKAKISK